MDLYKKMGKELRSLFSDIFDPRMGGVVRQKIDRILALSEKIGGTYFKEAKMLHKEVLLFLEKPSDPNLLNNMKKHALHLELETREI